jgi:hypothetical protein
MSRAKNVKSRRSFVLRLAILLAVFGFGVDAAQAQFIVENFDDITALPNAGWAMRNNSQSVGSSGWFQGLSFVFPAQAGAADSYIGANFNNTINTNTISNWLIMPTTFLSNGNVLRFWTRTVTNSQFPDRLEVRLSTNGSSTNIGTGPNDVGDFTTLLLTVNPTLTLGGYPEVWTQYTITLSGLPPGGGDCNGFGMEGRFAFRYFVTAGGPAGDNSNYIGIDTVNYIGAIPAAPSLLEPPLDYNCDGKTDYVVVRNTGGGSSGQSTWFINNGTTSTQTPWGISSDFFVSGDFDGDDKADITVYRREEPGISEAFFYTLRSSNSTFLARQLGRAGDDPTVVGDYDGDDIDDYAVYRGGTSAGGQPSFWYYRGSATANGGITFVQYGQSGDFPAPGDYDGDRKNDFCVQRNNGNNEGVFLLAKSSGGTEAVFWGYANDLIVPGDYDGDLRTDFAVVRGTGGQIFWSVLGRNNYNIIHYSQPWGLTATDYPTQGDYDGDGKTDIAVFRPNGAPQQTYFYVRKSSNGTLSAAQWGQLGDYPVANFNAH